MTSIKHYSPDLTPQEAIQLQKQLASRVQCIDVPHFKVRYIGGIDCALSSRPGYIRSAVVIMTYPELQLVEQHWHEELITWPYIPGLLSFREIPCMLNVLSRIKQNPDVLLVDGMGIAHPRRLGIASHLGLSLTIPTIGCGKSRLIGNYNHDLLEQQAPSMVHLMDKQECIGYVVRTRTNVQPIFVSVGNNISLETAVAIVLNSVTRYRLPEPIRMADKLSKKLKFRR